MHPKLLAVVDQHQVEEEAGHACATTWSKHQTDAEEGCLGDELEQFDGPDSCKQP